MRLPAVSTILTDVLDTPRVRYEEEHRVSADESHAHGAACLRWILRALRGRNYRLYFGGQCISLIETWMQRMALSWWVYRHTHSALVLGVVGFAGQIPALLLAPLTGALVDRWDRHRLLVVTQILAMLQALGLAWLRIGGVGCLLGAIVFARHLPTLRDMIRPIYAKMGLIQDAALRTQRALDAYLHAHH